MYHVAFISKNLTGAQINWSVKEKECFAIVYALKKFKYLLRGRTFKLFTDHRNLLYLDSESSAKVVHWRLAIQNYDFTLGHIAGEQNIVADQLSRLCPRAPAGPMPKLTQLATLGQIGTEDTQINLAMPVITSAVPTVPETGTHNDEDIDNEDRTDEVDYEADVAGRVSSFVKNKPTTRQYKAISAVHNSLAGHQSIKNTMSKLKQQNVHWEYMRRHVEGFIRHCPQCQKLSQVKTSNTSQQFTASSYYPMERLAIDFAGPHEDGGYVLLVIDTFSRWVELFPTPTASAEATLPCLVQMIGRYQAP